MVPTVAQGDLLYLEILCGRGCGLAAGRSLARSCLAGQGVVVEVFNVEVLVHHLHNAVRYLQLRWVGQVSTATGGGGGGLRLGLPAGRSRRWGRWRSPNAE